MTGHAAGPGEILFRFVRHWARRANQISSPVFADLGRDVMITEAVLAASKRGDPTIADVASELGIDQSGARLTGEPRHLWGSVPCSYATWPKRH